MQGKGRPPLWLTVVGGLAALTTLIPLIYLIVRATGGDSDSLVQLFQRPRVLLLLWNTVSLGVAVAVTATTVGLLAAFVLARFAIPARRFWIMCASVPLAVPSYLAAYGLLATFPGLQGFWGSWLVLSAVTTPYVTLPVLAALRQGTTGFDDLSRTLGVPAIRALIPGTWHQIRGATLAGAILVFLYTIADFGGVALFRFPVLTTAIQQAYGASYDRQLAAMLSLILVCLALIVVYFERKARGRMVRIASRSSTQSRQIRVSRKNVWLFAAVIVPTFVGAVVPMAVMVFRMFDVRAWAQLDWYNLFEATGNTILLSVSGATLGLLLAAPIAVLAGLYRSKLVTAIESLGYLPLALPGIVVGLALVLFALSAVPALYQTSVLLAFAYALLFMPKAVGLVRGAVTSVPKSLVDVSSTLGFSPRQRTRNIYVPMMRNSILVAWLLLAVSAMKELPATLLLRPTGMDTLATVLWAKTDVASFGSGAPYAIMLVVVAAVPALFLSQSSSSREVNDARIS